MRVRAESNYGKELRELSKDGIAEFSQSGIARRYTEFLPIPSDSVWTQFQEIHTGIAYNS